MAQVTLTAPELWKMRRRESKFIFTRDLAFCDLITVLHCIFSRKYQTWGSGLSVVSHDDRHDIKKARKEGRINEAMLDRRAKLKQ